MIAALAESLCDVCRLFGQRQWCLATSGNFSARIDADEILITQSGKDKARLSLDDLMICDMQGQARDRALTPSAESALHLCLYRHDPGIGAIFHTHSATATVLSRRAGGAIEIGGYEMQKAFAGIRSHETRLSLPVFDNTQDMAALAGSVSEYLCGQQSPVPGFLIRGHGLYGWGRDIREAQRHLEALEFLLTCIAQEDPANRK